MWILIIGLIACEDSYCRTRELAIREFKSPAECRREGKVMKEVYAPLYTKVTFRCEKD